MKYILLSLSAALLLGAAASAEPAYDSDDLKLEGMLAVYKDSADEGDLAAMRQVYLHYGFAGKQEQAQAWAQKFLDTLRERAEQGDVAAMSDLGRAYLAGDACITPDPVQAAAWLSRASAQGDAPSAYMLGEMLAQQNNEADAKVAYARAYGLFRQRAENGDRDARYWQGYMELRGVGTEKPEQPDAILRAMVAEEHLPAAYQLFKYAAEQGDDETALLCARLLADKGQDPQMAYYVATAAYEGKGMEPNSTQADRYLQQAVDAGMPAALYHRAWQLEEEGKNADAFRLFSEAAAAGHEHAPVKAGVMLLEGRGCEQDEAKGLQYLQRAAEVQQSPFAAWELARHYTAIGERELADSYIISASDRGLDAAMARRGLLHLIPASGVDWSPTEAYRWWTRGAESGDATCRLYLRLYLYLFIPLLVVLVFAGPMLAARLLLKREKE